jgi:hypothetical protein
MSVKNSTAVISSRDMMNGFENSHRKDFWGLIGMGYLNGKGITFISKDLIRGHG